MRCTCLQSSDRLRLNRIHLGLREIRAIQVIMLDFNVQDLGTSERLGPFRVEGFGACGLQLWGYTSWPVFQELDDKNGRGGVPSIL